MTPLFEQLVEALRILPGVGPKSAQRMAFHVLERSRGAGLQLSGILAKAIEGIQKCQQCRNLSETPICHLCENTQRRDTGQLCVVESPSDVQAIEDSGLYHGSYFVLHGHLSPIDGIGPEDLGLDKLESWLADDQVNELILATNPTIEGEATAYYLAELARAAQVPVTRIAHGVPVGGQLDHIDGQTLGRALDGRQPLN